MLYPSEAALALQRLVLPYHKPLTSGGPFIVCFDEVGTELDTDEVSAAHPKEMVGKLGVWTPTPGTGYYAHIRHSGGNVDRHTGVVTRWEVEGPDWGAFVDVYEPWNQGIYAKVDITAQLTAGALSFLERYRAL